MKKSQEESTKPRMLPPMDLSPHSAWGFLHPASLEAFCLQKHFSCRFLRLSHKSTNGHVIRNSIKCSIYRFWIVSPNQSISAMVESFNILRIWSHCTHSIWAEDMLTSMTFTRESSHPFLGDWKGFSCICHNYCLCKQFRILQAITLRGNLYYCELCFSSDLSRLEKQC